MADDVIEMQLTCSGCGQTIFNDQIDIRHPLDFLRACEDRGWQAPRNPPGPPTCPSCIAKGKL